MNLTSTVTDYDRQTDHAERKKTMERTRLVGEIDLTNQSEHWTLVHVSDTLPSETPEKRVWHHDYDHFEEAADRVLDGVASQWRGYSFDVESI